jgi:hypothetical protein
MLRMEKLKGVNRCVAIAALGVASLAMLVQPGTAKATVITYPQTLSPVPSVSSLPSGTVVAHETESFTGTVTFGTITDTITGSLFSEVVDVGTGGNHQYDFVYQVTNTGTGNDDEISRLSLSSFTGVTTDVSDSAAASTYSVAGTIAPTSVSDPDPSGDIITWDFDPSDIGQGQTTYSLIIATDANSYTQGNGSLTDDAIANASAEAPAFEMGITVPEPTSMALAAVFGGMLMYRRQRSA